jgi:hypothetical protein
MRANPAGPGSSLRRSFSVGLLLVAIIGGCSLLKKKGDTGPDAQVSAAPVVSIAPVVSVPAVAVPSVASAAAAVVAPATRVQPRTQTATATTTGTATAASAAASATAAPSADPGPAPMPIPVPSAQPTATATTVAPTTAPAGIINPQCAAACQKSYQDCINQSGDVKALEVLKKCRQALAPCLTTCR